MSLGQRYSLILRLYTLNAFVYLLYDDPFISF
jgi:hypothetical protein